MSSLTDEVGKALRAAISSQLPGGVDCVDYDEKASDAERQVQLDLWPVYSGDGTATQRRMNDRYGCVTTVIADTSTNARLYLDRTFDALRRRRIAVPGGYLTGSITHETTDPITYADDVYRTSALWYFTLGEMP